MTPTFHAGHEAALACAKCRGDFKVVLHTRECDLLKSICVSCIQAFMAVVGQCMALTTCACCHTGSAVMAPGQSNHCCFAVSTRAPTSSIARSLSHLCFHHTGKLANLTICYMNPTVAIITQTAVYKSYKPHPAKIFLLRLNRNRCLYMALAAADKSGKQ